MHSFSVATPPCSAAWYAGGKVTISSNESLRRHGTASYIYIGVNSTTIFKTLRYRTMSITCKNSSNSSRFQEKSLRSHFDVDFTCHNFHMQLNRSYRVPIEFLDILSKIVREWLRDHIQLPRRRRQLFEMNSKRKETVPCHSSMISQKVGYFRNLVNCRRMLLNAIQHYLSFVRLISRHDVNKEFLF